MIRLTTPGPVPKPVKEDKQKLTAKEFQKKYANPKRKEKGVADLKKELDAWFSRRVRLSECDSNYIARCVDCGASVDVRKADCGHYHSRKYNATRWIRENCAVQKKWCNRMMNDPKVHEAFKNELIKRHGEGIIQNLEIQKNNYFKLTRFNLGCMIDDNKRLVERMLKDKRLKKWW